MTDTANPWNDPAFAAAWNEAYGLTMDKAVTRAGLVYPWLEQQVGDFTGKDLIDFGCGNGNLIHHFRGHAFASWHGYDSGRAILDTARHITDPRVRLDTLDLASGEIGGFKRADIVASVFVIEEIPAGQLIRFFRNVANALKDDGTACFVTNHPSYAMTAPEGKFEGHKGYFDTGPTTYNLDLLNRREGEPIKVAYHHKTMGMIFNAMGTSGLKLDTMDEVPAGIISMAKWRSHRPKSRDIPRFLMFAASRR